MFASHGMHSFLTGPIFPLIWSMCADTADYGEWKFGCRATGLIFSAGSFAQKLGWSFGAAVTGWLLALFGFHANVVQQPGTRFGIRVMISIVPAAVSLAAMLGASLYPLGSKQLNRIETELRERRGMDTGGPRPATAPATQGVN
jgi:GPH family glycoside/pentoside/hexuronide:cation symporter